MILFGYHTPATNKQSLNLKSVIICQTIKYFFSAYIMQVNHKLNFEDLTRGAHTQNIKCLRWSV